MSVAAAARPMHGTTPAAAEAASSLRVWRRLSMPDSANDGVPPGGLLLFGLADGLLGQRLGLTRKRRGVVVVLRIRRLLGVLQRLLGRRPGSLHGERLLFDLCRRGIGGGEILLAGGERRRRGSERNQDGNGDRFHGRSPDYGRVPGPATGRPLPIWVRKYSRSRYALSSG